MQRRRTPLSLVARSRTLVLVLVGPGGHEPTPRRYAIESDVGYEYPVLDNLLDLAGGAIASLFQGCFLTLAIPVLATGSMVAFATGHTHEGWTQAGVCALCIVWGIALATAWVHRQHAARD
jgi:hypothetical protein